MTLRRVSIFAVLALLVIAGAMWLSSQRQLPRATLAGDLVLPGLAGSVNEVATIRITRGDGTITTLQRQDTGEWQVGERAWRADVARLRRLLLDAAALAVVEEKTRVAANYAALGVDEPNRPDARGTLLEIRAPQRNFALILGRNSGTKSSFVRVPGHAASALATPQITLDPQPSAWLDKQLLDLPQERVKQLTRSPAASVVKNAAVAPPDPSFAAFTFDDLRTAATIPPTAPRLVIETKDGMVVELIGLRPKGDDGSRSDIAVTARALEGAEPKVHREASDLATRTAGREFELPGYRYETLFPAARAPPAAKKPGR
jgi:Domain of unknown function (DUF4340)